MRERLRFWGGVILLCASILGTGYFAKAAVESGVLIYGNVYSVVGTGVFKESPLRVGVNSGGFLGCDTYQPINQAAGSNVLLVNNQTTTKNVYICQIHLVTAAALNIAIVEGTGSPCTAAVAGMAGGATAATGYNLAANSGIVLGDGVGAVMKTATVGHNVCMFPSGAGQISGGVWSAIR